MNSIWGRYNQYAPFQFQKNEETTLALIAAPAAVAKF